MDVTRRIPFILGFALLCAVRCLEVRLKDRTVYGQEGKPVELRSEYWLEDGDKLHSITWRVDKDFPTRILQYIVGKNTTLPSSPYRHRTHFDSVTGSLRLLDFTQSDQGRYQITVTAVDGAEDKDFAQVSVYEPVAGLVVAMTPNGTSATHNLTLSCSVLAGSDLQISWTKDGRNITERAQLVPQDSGLDLVLPVLSWDDCGTYTCSVWNQISRQSHSLSLTAYSPQCQAAENPRLRLRYLLLAPALLCFLLPVGMLVVSLRVGKMGFQKARTKVYGWRDTSNCSRNACLGPEEGDGELGCPRGE